MRIKPYLLAALLGTAVMSGSVASVSHAQQRDSLQAPVILAQSDNRGFLDKIFNKSNKGSGGADPLYLDGTETKGSSGSGSSTGRKPIQPYDFSAHNDRSGQVRNTRGMSLIEKQMAEQAAEREKEDARLTKMAQAINDEIERDVEAIFKAAEQNTNSAETASAEDNKKKIQVYDPDRAKNYDPNAKAEAIEKQRDRPRIYNSSR